jgi:hypothetical protein
MWVLLILGEINSGVLIDYFLKINIRLITTYLCINSYGEIVVSGNYLWVAFIILTSMLNEC